MTFSSHDKVAKTIKLSTFDDENDDDDGDLYSPELQQHALHFKKKKILRDRIFFSLIRN